MPTEQEAVNTIFGAFNTAWETNPSFLVVWPNKTPEIEVLKQKNPWAFVKIVTGKGRQMSLAGADGKKIWERKGQFGCEIYTPSGEGTVRAYVLARLVESAFIGKTIEKVRFRAIQIKEGGVHGNWFLINVIVDFEYDELI
ncbi:MAG: hypothetical protein H0X02_03760 [Nitrosomonas sp.]|nr:hypothetical protein [Nitrosomonas sp.]